MFLLFWSSKTGTWLHMLPKCHEQYLNRTAENIFVKWCVISSNVLKPFFQFSHSSITSLRDHLSQSASVRLLDLIFIPVAVFYSYIWNHTLEISFLNPLSYCRVEQRSLPLQVIFVVCSHHILTLLTSPCPWFPVFYVNEGFFFNELMRLGFLPFIKSHLNLIFY